MGDEFVGDVVLGDCVYFVHIFIDFMPPNDSPMTAKK